MERHVLISIFRNSDEANDPESLPSAIIVAEVLREHQLIDQVLDWYAKVYGFDRAQISGAWAKMVTLTAEKTQAGKPFLRYESKPNYPRLGSMMQELVEQAIGLAKNTQKRRGAAQAAWNRDDHHGICTEIAQRYGLTTPEHAFPIWLSRLIEGAIMDVRDYRDNEIPI